MKTDAEGYQVDDDGKRVTLFGYPIKILETLPCVRERVIWLTQNAGPPSDEPTIVEPAVTLDDAAAQIEKTGCAPIPDVVIDALIDAFKETQ